MFRRSGGDPIRIHFMYYIARNTLAVTAPMSKEAALALWKANKATDGARYQLCKETGSINPVVVMELV